MTKQKATELVEETQKYLNREIQIKVLDDKNNYLRTATCKFTEVSSISISENDDEPVISLYAKCDEVNTMDYFTPTLQSVVNEFRRLDISKQ